jgi:hypothetical protein
VKEDRVYRLMLECGHYVLLPAWAGPSRLGDSTECNVCPYTPRRAPHGVDKVGKRMLRRVMQAERVWEGEILIAPFSVNNPLPEPPED